MSGEAPAYYLAPHADDVVLSCAGSVAADVAAGRAVTLLTVFLSGADEAVRRAEDQAAAAALGCAWACLELPDAPERPEIRGRLGLFARYGQAHLGITNEVVSRLRARLDAGAATAGGGVVLRAPLAVGGHIDHRVVHEAARALAFERGADTTLSFYEDQPYSLAPFSLARRLDALELTPAAGVRLPRGTFRAERAAYRDHLRALPAGRAMLPGWRFLALHIAAGAAVRSDLGGQRPGPRPRLRAELRAVDAYGDVRRRAVAAYASQWPLFAESAEALCARIEAYGRALPGADADAGHAAGPDGARAPICERLWYDDGARG